MKGDHHRIAYVTAFGCAADRSGANLGYATHIKPQGYTRYQSPPTPNYQ